MARMFVGSMGWTKTTANIVRLFIVSASSRDCREHELTKFRHT